MIPIKNNKIIMVVAGLVLVVMLGLLAACASTATNTTPATTTSATTTAPTTATAPVTAPASSPAASPSASLLPAASASPTPSASAASSPTGSASPEATSSPSAVSSPSASVSASAPASPSTSASSTAASGGAATTINLVAQSIAFNMKTITIPAGAQITVNFNNMDSGIPHNFATYTDSSATTKIFVGQIITGPATTTYTFTAPTAPGTYYFRCDVHPTIMTGQLIVK